MGQAGGPACPCPAPAYLPPAWMLGVIPLEFITWREGRRGVIGTCGTYRALKREDAAREGGLL